MQVYSTFSIKIELKESYEHNNLARRHKKDQTARSHWSVLTTADKPMTAIEIAEKLGDSDTTWMSTTLSHPRITRNKRNRYPVQHSWVAIWPTMKLRRIHTATMRYVLAVALWFHSILALL